jgi:hypothetical protein
MSQAAQEEVYADDPNTLVSSSYNPVGAKAEMADGRLHAQRPLGLEFGAQTTAAGRCSAA